MKRQESIEDYLETILRLKQSIGLVRSIDVVNEMGFSKPSVSVAMKNMREKGLVIVDGDGYISLTDEGQTKAESIDERHKLLYNAFIAIGVSEAIAGKDACRIENDLSDETFQKIKELMEKLKHHTI